MTPLRQRFFEPLAHDRFFIAIFDLRAAFFTVDGALIAWADALIFLAAEGA